MRSKSWTGDASSWFSLAEASFSGLTKLLVGLPMSNSHIASPTIPYWAHPKTRSLNAYCIYDFVKYSTRRAPNFCSLWLPVPWPIFVFLRLLLLVPWLLSCSLFEFSICKIWTSKQVAPESFSITLHAVHVFSAPFCMQRIWSKDSAGATTRATHCVIGARCFWFWCLQLQ